MTVKPYVPESQGYKAREIVAKWNRQIGLGLPVIFNGEPKFCKSDAYYNSNGCFVEICGELEPVELDKVKPQGTGDDTGDEE